METTRPPIHLSASIPADLRMNNDILRAYTKNGKEVDYIVWLVMYLYENGPVLIKGLAQPKWIEIIKKNIYNDDHPFEISLYENAYMYILNRKILELAYH